MRTVFVNDNSGKTGTLKEITAAFFVAWDPLGVEKVLWEVFAFASIGGLGERVVLGTAVLPADEVASLFDQLIELLKACEGLQEQGGANVLLPEGGKPHV
ncbi:hypothetical protein [Mucilaginibacter sp.]|uniref:hypothetical protein n=1 Tax=Mucilaginibacter sp. TaxID=1882438 RepID=UPI0032647274